MSPAFPLRRILRLAAALMLVATLAVWLATGAHRGWTRTSVTDMQHDAVTGIDFPVERRKFVAGVELLGAGVAVAGLLGLSSLLPARRKPPAAPP